MAGNGLGRQPHTVKGPEIGRHPNPSPAGERGFNSNEGRSENANSSGSADDFVAALPVLGEWQLSGNLIAFMQKAGRSGSNGAPGNHLLHRRPVTLVRA